MEPEELNWLIALILSDERESQEVKTLAADTLAYLSFPSTQIIIVIILLLFDFLFIPFFFFFFFSTTYRGIVGRS